MRREEVIGALVEAVEREGYRVHRGAIERLNGELEKLPAAWIEPPKLIKVEGRNEGLRSYSLALTFIDDGAAVGATAEEGEGAVERAWQKMEQSGESVAQSLRKLPEIIWVELKRGGGATESLTNWGDCSYRVEYEIGVPFFRVQ